MSGKKNTASTTTAAIGAIKIQQSTYGSVIPVVWGCTRLTGNLIWYGDFKAVQHLSVNQSGGKGGGAAPTPNVTYTYQAAVMMGLCEGPILGVRKAWRGKNVYTGDNYTGRKQVTTEDTYTYPAAGTTITVSNTNGWVPISVETVSPTANSDPNTFINRRRAQWVALVQGVDYTCANGVYTFLTAAQYQGAQVRISYMYTSAATGISCLSKIGLDLTNGTPGQAPWSYLTSNHSDQAVGYSGIAYVSGATYSLDSGASVENHAFEVMASFMFNGDVVPDADPSKIVVDALCNPQYGVSFGREKIGSTTDFSNACVAQGIFLSPALTEQVKASDFLKLMSQLTNIGLVWSDGVLKFVPYTDTAFVGNNVTFTPNTTPIYDLTDDDFQPTENDGPIKVTRGAVSDTFNSVKLEYFDRANDYNIAIMAVTDDADIQENGLREMPVVTAHWITTSPIAKMVAQLILQRSMFIRNTYEFTLGWTKIGLEPMDLVTVTDTSLGLNKQPVRILSIEEDEAGLLAVTAEDFPKGNASATLYPSTSGNGYTPNFNEDPGTPSAPVIFEGPAALASSQSGLEVWLAAGGLAAGYGGCEVWVSLTGSNYQRAAVMRGSSRYGTTSGTLAAATPGAITTDTLGVTLTDGGQLLAASYAEMQALNTLCYVDGEFIAYETSTLTGTSAYSIGNHMQRGAFLSNPSSHAAGVPFVRCDQGIARMPLTSDYIGKQIHIKLLPFNRYGGATGSLANATEYLYTVTGMQANLPPIAPPNLGLEGAFTISAAKFKWDRVGNAASYNVQIWATVNGTLTKVREVNAGNSLRYDYTSDDAHVDGGPWRSLTVKVQGINANGAAGAFSTYTATNPQVGALTNAVVASSAGNIQFSCDRPADTDFSGIQVWLSATSGFTPGSSTLVYDGPSNNVTINRQNGGAQLALGSTYYLRAGAYDTFDKSGMTLTAELPVSISNATGSQTAIVQLYKWSTSAPAAPTGTTTFTWASGANTGYASSPADGWQVSPPANPGTPLAQMFIATIQIAAPIGTSTSTVSYSSATVAAWSQNGNNGTNGTSGMQADAAVVYQWAATIPAAPSGSPTWTWSSRSFGAAPTGWNLTPGTSPSAGMTLWAAKVPIQDVATATTTAFNWSSSSITAAGYAGSTGPQGLSYVAAYCVTTTPTASGAPSATSGISSLPAANSSGLTGTWSASAPASVPAGSYLFMTTGPYDPSTNLVTWGVPYISSAKFGSLSAVSTNTGNLTVTGTMSDGSNNWSVDSTGKMICKSFVLQASDGSTILQGGAPLAVSYVPAAALNSNITINANGTLTGGGSGQVTIGGLGYSGAMNATADITLIGRGVTVNGNTATKTGGASGTWDSDVYSADSFTGGAYASAVAVDTAHGVMFGLNSDPTTDSNYTSLDYALYLSNSGTLTFYESGTAVGPTNLTYVAGDVAAVVYDGSSVKYLKNGAVVYTSAASSASTPNQVLFFDSSFLTSGATIKNIRFGPLSSNNWASIGGANKPANNATVGAPAGTLVGNTAASTVESNAANGAAAYTSVNDATTGLATRMSKSAANILSGSGGLAAGTLAWDTNGARTGGYGVAMTQKGILGYNSAGVATFTLDAGTGATTAKSITILADDGSTVLSSGTSLAQQTSSNPNLCPTPLGFLMDNGGTGNRNGDVRFGDGQYLYIPVTSDSSYCGAHSTALGIPQNSQYTVSFDAYCAGAARALNASVYGTNVDNNGLRGIALSNTMTRYKFTETMTSNATGDAYLRFWTGAPGGSYIIIANIKVELGNTMTPWCDSVITKANASTFIQSASIQSAMVSDLRTSNYAEDGSGNPTAGGKLASQGTALKVASGGFQVGTVLFTDYWYRLTQGIDGSYANGKVIWRGNNDVSTRGGAPNIGCLSITPVASQVLNSNFQQIYHQFKITPTALTDNLDAMQQIHIQLFGSTSSAAPFIDFYWPCPSRSYSGDGSVQGSWSWGWRFAGSGAMPTVSQQYESNGVFSGCIRATLINSYGPSATQDFAPGQSNGTALGYTTITGSAGSGGGGTGGGGGACPAPWVKIRLISGREIVASDLHDGARVAAVDDNTMAPLPNGGVVRDVSIRWAMRYRVKLANGEATEWSENHRFYVVDRGWVRVQHLRPGDQVAGQHECIVDSVLATGEQQVVGFRVEGAGTYFGGGMLCHNIKQLP